MTAVAPTPRRASRLLVLDPEGRVLLLRDREPLTGRAFWITPGGGLNDGETHLEAARRELAEETGLRDVEIGPELWRGRRRFHARGEDFDQEETYFLVRCEPFEVDMSGVEEYERGLEARWWTVAELERTPEFVLPRELAMLVAGVLRDGAPPVVELLPG